ncbi:MAG TPA: CoA transferase [Acidimicrobiales bacterium]|nr:CoA transferase [Acidimicrobiales bacterium]
MTGPLAGVRIVMMGGLGPGPFCGMLLGDLGADVVRVDRLADVARTQVADRVVRRSQRSIAVDVKDERGAELVRTLVDGADAFVDVFRPGALERLGLGPDDLRARNPRLVYARMTDGVVQPAPAPRFSRAVPSLPSSPALPGAHTHAVLAELGVDPAGLTEVVAQR